MRVADLAGTGALAVRVAAATTADRLRGRALNPEWPWRTEVVARAIKATFTAVEGADAATVRAVIDRAALKPPLAVRSRDEAWSGVRCVRFVPRLRAAAPCLLYIHGGGYNFGSVRSHQNLLLRLAKAGLQVVAVEYRLAPEHPFPAAHDDVWHATCALLDAEGAERVVIAGDSAGGGLAAATLLRLRAAGRQQPAAAVLLSPWVDMTLSRPSTDTNLRYDFLASRAQGEAWARAYLGQLDAADPRVSPVFATDLSGLAPQFVAYGGKECLHDECAAWVDRSRAAGNDVDVLYEPQMFHDWMLHAPLIPEAAPAIAHIAAFAKRHAVR